MPWYSKNEHIDGGRKVSGTGLQDLLGKIWAGHPPPLSCPCLICTRPWFMANQGVVNINTLFLIFVQSAFSKFLEIRITVFQFTPRPNIAYTTDFSGHIAALMSRVIFSQRHVDVRAVLEPPQEQDNVKSAIAFDQEEIQRDGSFGQKRL
ncbi:hypothetical protein J6590_061222 [Homalodisca vitripennis]|nr:hypothetical protein J6590_061222 [Homalodisca vitripennis]